MILFKTEYLASTKRETISSLDELQFLNLENNSAGNASG